MGDGKARGPPKRQTELIALLSVGLFRPCPDFSPIFPTVATSDSTQQPRPNRRFEAIRPSHAQRVMLWAMIGTVGTGRRHSVYYLPACRETP